MILIIQKMKKKETVPINLYVLNLNIFRKTEQAIEKTRSILEGAVQSQSQQQSRSRHHAMQSMYQSQSTSGGHQTNSLPRVRDHGDGYTYTVYNFYDEKVPYRTKMPSKEPTLKIFKEVIHKKGNHR